MNQVIVIASYSCSVLWGVHAKASRQQQIRNLVFIIIHSTKGGKANGIALQI